MLPEAPPVAPGKAINLGARGLAAPEATSQEASKDEAEGLKFSAKVGVASDYVYRGTTLSDHRPAFGAAIEATFAGFYAWTSAASVRLPTEPDAELAFGAGIRRTIGNADFDLGASYFTYPGDMRGAASIDYWEAAFRSEVKAYRVAARGPAASPIRRISPTPVPGAGMRHRVLATSCPPACCPPISASSFTAAAGYSWFGEQSDAPGRLAAARLPELACGRDLHLQIAQSRPALLRHQPVEGELLRLHRRCRRRAGRAPRSDHATRPD